jgi:hypothetical protein
MLVPQSAQRPKGETRTIAANLAAPPASSCVRLWHAIRLIARLLQLPLAQCFLSPQNERVKLQTRR